MQPKLSILLPSIQDFDGVYFTAQAMRLCNDLSECEILVGEGKPGHPIAGELRRLFGDGAEKIGLLSRHNAGTRFIDTSKADGTAQTKELLIQEARGEFFICLDAHVLLLPNAITKLVEYYRQHPNTSELLTGPLVYDTLEKLSTHFDNAWRGEMWGTWGTAWRSPCDDGDGELLSVRDDNGRLRFHSLDWDGVPLTRSARCGVEYPDIPFSSHEPALRALGFTEVGWNEDDDFVIPAHGMGLFSCRKAAWPGFNPMFRGFGGEEMYIHEKLRQRGGATRCLGFLRWLHRFAKPNGIAYRLTQWDKARNYVIGLQELGLPIEPVRDLFVTGKAAKLSEYQWSRLVADPLQYHEPIEPTEIQVPPTITSTEDLYLSTRATPRDLDKHMDLMSGLAAQCEHVTEFSHRKESLIALGRPAGVRLASYNTEGFENNALLFTKLAEGRVVVASEKSQDVAAIEETDLLFIDQEHTYARVFDDLKRFAGSVRRFIVLHDTQLYAHRGEDGGPGLAPALLDFIAENPQWFFMSHTGKQHGLTVLAKREEDRPETEVKPWPPQTGPGAELHRMLESIGIHASATCSCRRLAADMNTWGVENCRQRRDVVVAKIHENYVAWGWKDKLGLLAAGGAAIFSGLAFKLNPFDPVGSLVDEAIKAAEARASLK